ncbi:MAG: YkgJ family cysteine cluster protein [Methanoregula sp.]
MAFECQQCGECCHHMAQVHTIKEVKGDFTFLVNNQYTGEKIVVTVDPDKYDLFADIRVFGDHPEACPFLRYHPKDNLACCTVHMTRPEICRDYGCWRMLILDSRGKRAGRVMEHRAFFSDDDDLAHVWKECIDDLTEPDDAVWDTIVIGILRKAGYTVRV